LFGAWQNTILLPFSIRSARCGSSSSSNNNNNDAAASSSSSPSSYFLLPEVTGFVLSDEEDENKMKSRHAQELAHALASTIPALQRAEQDGKFVDITAMEE